MQNEAKNPLSPNLLLSRLKARGITPSAFPAGSPSRPKSYTESHDFPHASTFSGMGALSECNRSHESHANCMTKRMTLSAKYEGISDKYILI